MTSPEKDWVFQKKIGFNILKIPFHSLRTIVRTNAKSHARIQQNTLERKFYNFLNESNNEWPTTAEVDILRCDRGYRSIEINFFVQAVVGEGGGSGGMLFRPANMHLRRSEVLLQ